MDSDVLQIIARIARDTVDQRRIVVLSQLNSEPRKTSEVAALVDLPTETTKKILEDLSLLGFAEKAGSENAGYVWSSAGGARIPAGIFHNRTKPGDTMSPSLSIPSPDFIAERKQKDGGTWVSCRDHGGWFWFESGNWQDHVRTYHMALSGSSINGGTRSG